MCVIWMLNLYLPSNRCTMAGCHNKLIADQRSATIPLNRADLGPSEGSHMGKFAGIGFDAAHNQAGRIGTIWD